MPVRYRVLDVSTDHPFYPRVRSNFGVQNWGGWANNFVFPPHISYMTDVVGNQGNYNPCEHLELDSSMTNFVPFQGGGGSGTYTFLDEGCFWPLLMPGSFADWPWLPTFSAATLSDFSVDAFNAFHNQVPTTVSLPNFLYELREMKGMIPTIDRSSLSKTASNNFLAYEFGVVPFISDVKKILELSDSVQKRIKHLLETQGKTTDLRFDRDLVLTEPYSFSKSFLGPYSLDMTWSGRFRRVSAKAHLHIGATLQQDLTGLSDALTQLKALSASGGFNSPLRAVWNAIPFSFLVDWFFHVGKLLDTLSVQPYGGEYNVGNVGYSVKSEAVFYAEQVILAAGNGGIPDQVSPIGTVTAKGYSRKVGFPATSLFLTDGSLSPMQQVLGIALLEQYRK